MLVFCGTVLEHLCTLCVHSSGLAGAFSVVSKRLIRTNLFWWLIGTGK